METLEPRDEQDLLEMVRSAVAGEMPLEVAGFGSKAALGRPVEAEARITTRLLDGVTMYEPAELVFTAKAGTKMSTIRKLLDEQDQELAFEPIGYHRLYGLEPLSGEPLSGEPLSSELLSGSIGGMVGVNASGPRRIKAGAARDHLLGFRAISGRAEIFKSGGRVMKNVTGYDLSKLMTGSYGTLGIMSEVTLKVLPKPETEETLLISGLDDAAGIKALCDAAGSPHDVSSLAHLPKGASEEMPSTSVTALRLEGPEISVTKRKADLIAHFKDAAAAAGGSFEELAVRRSKIFWGGLREAGPLAGLKAQVWRVSTAPGNGAQFVGAITKAGVPLERWFYDWSGGLVWLAVSDAPDAHARAIRGALAEFGGHATLVRADAAVRSATEVFQPQPRALRALSVRVKAGFDPGRILNRGRLREDL